VQQPLRALDHSQWRSLRPNAAAIATPFPNPHTLHHKFWPKRLPHRISAPAISLWHNLTVSALRYPNKPALVFFGQIFTYAEVLQQAERLAATLHEMGVQKGDRVRDTYGYRCALRLAQSKNPSVLNLPSRMQHDTSPAAVPA